MPHKRWIKNPDLFLKHSNRASANSVSVNGVSANGVSVNSVSVNSIFANSISSAGYTCAVRATAAACASLRFIPFSL